MISEDTGLEQELLRDAHASLHTIGALEITLAVVGIAADSPATLSWQPFLPIVLGLVTLAAARWERLYAWSVPVAVLSCFVWAAMPEGQGGELGNLIPGRAFCSAVGAARFSDQRWFLLPAMHFLASTGTPGTSGAGLLDAPPTPLPRRRSIGPAPAAVRRSA